MPWELPALLDADLVSAGLAALQPLAFLTAGASLPADAFAAMASLEATNYLRNQLLRDSDWASMAHGLELRLPLVDYELLQRVAPLVAGVRRREQAGSGAKDALAQAPSLGLPAGLAQRPKTGFGIPMDSWLAECEALTAWRQHPLLRGPRVHWSRRLAYALVAEALGGRGLGIAVRGSGR
jgi:asparagine synthase (glutamine-hydrolysing)